jgi:hypothetical protein
MPSRDILSIYYHIQYIISPYYTVLSMIFCIQFAHCFFIFNSYFNATRFSLFLVLHTFLSIFAFYLLILSSFPELHSFILPNLFAIFILPVRLVPFIDSISAFIAGFLYLLYSKVTLVVLLFGCQLFVFA